MKRETKFRGWFTQFNDMEFWVYGYFYKESGTGNSYIHNGSEIYCVDEESVSEFTGLLDKHGREIYEGDILRYHFFQKYDNLSQDYEPCSDICTGRVEYAGCSFSIIGNDYGPHLINTCVDWVEVIGNIHEHPHLLTP